MAKKKLIYISAPITGMEDTAEERFTNAVRPAKEHGFIAVNPYAENKNYNKRSDAIIAELHSDGQILKAMESEVTKLKRRKKS